MHWLDYGITLIPVAIIAVIAWTTRKYMKGVADFMAASRCAGRYLVCNASGEAGFGAVSAVAIFEYIYKTGFAITWWGFMSIPVGLIMTLTGFFVYRYRETRVLTLAQFFEVRYSKGFRILSGILGWLSGVLNFGIFPVVGARFFVNYCGLPQNMEIFGTTLPTFGVLMAVFISLALFLTLTGGQLTIMITDCLEGLLSGVFYLIVAAGLLYLFSWSEMFTVLSAAPAGNSMLDPFDTGQAKDFNIWYVLIGIIGGIYGCGGWQGGHAFRASAANPHEAKMGNILGGWRGFGRGVMITLLGICAMTYLNHPAYTSQAARVHEALQSIPEKQIQTQMLVPVALGHLLPIGIKGCFASIIFFAMVACDGSYMHSWGSIFVQDIVLPFRRKPFTPRQHIRLLRWSIAGVGLFAFFFGLFFPQTEYILMFFAITGTIFLGGCGAVILGGLYWKKGTNQAAWVSMLAGSILATGGIILGQFPYAAAPMKIRAPEAVSVTVDGKPARRVGDQWEHAFKFTRMEEWQSATIVVKTKDAAMTNSVHYAFGRTAPEKRPTETTAPSFQVEPASLTLMPRPQPLGSRLFIALRSINGQWLMFISMCVATVLYIVVSLLTSQEDFNMDRMLHRGKYAIETRPEDSPESSKRHFSWGGILGFDRDFTFGDKILSSSLFVWSMLWFGVFCVGTAWYAFLPEHRWSLENWGRFWHIYAIVLPFVFGVVTTVWFTWGGIRDLVRLLAALKTVHRSELDDGMVVGHHNLDEEGLTEDQSGSKPPS